MAFAYHEPNQTNPQPNKKTAPYHSFQHTPPNHYITKCHHQIISCTKYLPVSGITSSPHHHHHLDSATPFLPPPSPPNHPTTKTTPPSPPSNPRSLDARAICRLVSSNPVFLRGKGDGEESGRCPPECGYSPVPRHAIRLRQRPALGRGCPPLQVRIPSSHRTDHLQIIYRSFPLDDLDLSGQKDS